MGVCLGGATALEVYRSSGRLLPELLEHPRTSKLDGCDCPSPVALEDELKRLGVRGRPCCLVIADKALAGGRKDIRRRVLVPPVPLRSFVRVRGDVLVTSPELTFALLACDGDVDLLDLVLIGYELCGTYVLDPDPESWDGLVTRGVR